MARGRIRLRSCLVDSSSAAAGRRHHITRTWRLARNEAGKLDAISTRSLDTLKAEKTAHEEDVQVASPMTVLPHEANAGSGLAGVIGQEAHKCLHGRRNPSIRSDAASQAALSLLFGCWRQAPPRVPDRGESTPTP